MSEQMTTQRAAELRKPFPPGAVGKLPKGGAMLDFVGHATTTDRLLIVDPAWNWEPFAVDANGLPALDSRGNLWIRLTVCGVTRIGVGDGPSAKVLIGDAIRNAAMRFGVALDLWSKDELEQTSGTGADKLRATLAAKPGAKVDPAPISNEPEPADPGPTTEDEPVPMITSKQRGLIKMLAKELDLEADRPKYLAGLSHYAGREITSSNDLTAQEAGRVIDALSATKAERLAMFELGATEAQA